ncbi:MAG: recombinase [Micromonosporaceae bacterium]|nr:recombinase [Micromonosporaceae bacterium]
MFDSASSDWMTCPQCDRTLPLTDFHRNQRRPNGRSFYRKQCANQRTEASRRKRGVGRRKQPDTAVPAGMKWCPDCGETKSLDDFVRTTRKASGLHSYCRPCHNARGRETKERLYGGTREYHLRHRYGIGQQEFDELLAEQGGVCAICGADRPEHVDHDHRTGWIRGILCFNCNGGLGQFRDDPEHLSKAITYLRGATWHRVLIHPGVYRVSLPRRGRPRSWSSRVG